MLLANAFAFVVGFLLFIHNFPMLIVCRLCQGICVGFFTSIVPLIICELSPTEISGSLGSYTELHICLGIFFGCFFPYVLLKITGDTTGHSYWFLVFGLPQVVILLQSLLLIFAFPY
jgi:MFS family permease